MKEEAKEYSENDKKLKETIDKIDKLWSFKQVVELFDISKEQINTTDKEIEEKEQQKEKLESEIEQLSNKIIGNIDEETIEKFNGEMESFLKSYDKQIKQIVINELLYQDLRNEVERLKKQEGLSQEQKEEKLLEEVLQKQSIEDKIKNIKEDKDRINKEKKKFVECNLLLQKRLLDKCENNFDKKFNNDIVEDNEALRMGLVGWYN